MRPMSRSVFTCLFLLYALSIIAQPNQKGRTGGPAIESIPLLTFEGRFYPEFLLDEKFFNSQVSYPISDELMVDLQVFYSRFGIKERIRLPLFLRVKIAKNLYLLAGPEIEYDLSGEVQASKPRMSINSGVEYKREDGFYINALFNYQINNSNVGPQGNIGKSNLISVGSGIKF